MTPSTQAYNKEEDLYLGDLSHDEKMLLGDCLDTIRKHVDRHISRSKNSDQIDRLISFRSYIR